MLTRTGLSLLALFAVLAGGVAWLKLEHEPPTASFAERSTRHGPLGSWSVDVKSSVFSGLRLVRVRLNAGGESHVLTERVYPAESWMGSGVSEDRIAAEANFVELGIPEGRASIVVEADTHSWRIDMGEARVVLERRFDVDLTPSSLEILSRQHNLRLGGSSLALFRVGADAQKFGVAVADYYFPGVRGLLADPNVVATVFAVPQDLSTDVRPQVEVVDDVGNVRRRQLPVAIRRRVFPERIIEIGEAFLERKIPGLLAVNDLEPQATLLDGYLLINGPFRRQTEAMLREAIDNPPGREFVAESFREQPGAAAMSQFGDRRIYTHEGREIDRQTHLGFDLASVRLAEIVAAQAGVVRHAGNLGIYGDTVVVDHGLGVHTLYAHLSSVLVAVGDRVDRGVAIGRSGESGLAGGDHLHYSTIVSGVHVDPVEWWDPNWVKDHITSKLSPGG